MQLSFTNYRKTFGAVEVLKINNLQLEPGIYWVKGENGSGKSTLLKSIAGIIDFEGKILLNDSLNPFVETIDYRRLVNFSEAEPLFPEFLTGKALIDLFTEAKNASSNQSEYYLKALKMADYIHQPIGSYSSGMVKKLSLVLAFLGTPQLILLDEPLITLDAESVSVLCGWIEKFSFENEISFIISSHQELPMTKSIKISSLLINNKSLKLC